jgi:MoxR-like ATPase
MTADQAAQATPQLGFATVVDYCRSQGFPFEPDFIARYLASLLAKPIVILAGVSGTGKSKLTELVAEFYCTTVSQGPAPLGTPTPIR